MTSKDFKRIILHKLTDILKPKQFRKAGNTFQYSNGELVYFINLQISQSSSADILRVTVNIEIASFSLSKLEDTSIPEKDRRHFINRIGNYLDHSHDKWWTIQNINEANASAEQIAEIIVSKILPEFNRIRTTNDLADLWRKHISPGLTEKQRKEYLSLINQ